MLVPCMSGNSGFSLYKISENWANDTTHCVTRWRTSIRLSNIVDHVAAIYRETTSPFFCDSLCCYIYFHYYFLTSLLPISEVLVLWLAARWWKLLGRVLSRECFPAFRAPYCMVLKPFSLGSTGFMYVVVPCCKVMLFDLAFCLLHVRMFEV